MTSSWVFIHTLLKQGKSVEEIADICKTTYKNMWNRIRRHEVKDNCIYMNEKQLRPRKNNNRVRGKTLAVCPVTRNPRVPEDCAECFEKDCKGKIQDDPEEKPVVFSRCSGCCHNLTDHCGLCVSAYGSEKGCNLFETEEGEILENMVSKPDEKEPEKKIPEEELIFVEQIPYKKPEILRRDELDRLYEKSKEEVKLETFAFTPEKLTVARSVYAEIERQIDHCEEMITMAKRTWTQMEKERRSWEAILNKIIPERSPEEDGEKAGGES